MYYVDPITGKRIQRSTKQANRRKAEREAAKWEADLNAGRYVRDVRITWESFRERYHDEKLAGLAHKTQDAFDAVANHLERLIGPKMLANLTPATLSRFQSKLRSTGMVETSIAAHLGHLRAAVNWAVKHELLAESPHFEIPKQAKGRKLMRGRPITAEEFERKLAVTSKVRPNDSAAWIHYLKGLWLSGLRLEESTIVSWDEYSPFMVDLAGKHPRFRIYGEAHKSRRDEYLPMTPDFAKFLLATPDDQRHGRVFKLNGLKTGKQISTKRISRLVGKIGERAGVVVQRTTVKDDDGKETVRAKYATAHDLRRSFASRWAKRVAPAILQCLMRHSDISTTMKYYVDLDADDIAATLWKSYDNTDRVGTFVGTSQDSAEPAGAEMPQV